MIPTLYNEAETEFQSNGIGKLSEAISCFVREERNGEYELEMEYPVSGKYYSEIKRSRIIFAVPADGKTGQAFRIYKITKPMDGIVTINAEHISYQLSLIPVTPFNASASNTAIIGIWSNAVGNNPFTHWSDISNESASYNVTVPKSMRACLGGSRGSFLDVYGGEFEWDNWRVKIHAQRGTNRGVTIRYGKNLTDFEQEENIQDVITGILPYWYNEEDNQLVMLTELVVMSSYANNYPFRRVLPVDLSEDFQSKPTEAQLRTAAQNYIRNNNIGIPKINIKISFVPLYLSEEYKSKALVERVNLCDTVNVYFEKLGISVTAKVIETNYNVLLDRYDSIELGDAKSSFSDTILKQSERTEQLEIKVAEKAAFLSRAIAHTTQLISGGLGGYVVIEPNPNTGYPEEILIMDHPNKEDAVNCIRINKNGIGFSQTGYEPPNFDTAWTIDGTFNANYIAAGQIDTSLLQTGTISDHNGKTTFDLDTGELKSKNLVIDTTNNGSLEIKSTNFTVTPQGNITLNNADMNNATLNNADVSGKITSTQGNIGGLEIYDEYLRHGTVVSDPTWRNIYTPYNKTGDVYVGKGGIATFGPTSGTAGCMIYDGVIEFKYLAETIGKIGIKEESYTQASNVYYLYDCDDQKAISIGNQFISIGENANHNLNVYGNCYIDGELQVGNNIIASSGQKYRAVKTNHFGTVGLAAMESPEPIFSDFGGNKIGANGLCYVEFDATFAETVELSCGYRVFYTQTSPGKIDYIEKRSSCFVVHGESATEFDWIVYAKQKDFSDCRFTKLNTERS